MSRVTLLQFASNSAVTLHVTTTFGHAHFLDKQIRRFGYIPIVWGPSSEPMLLNYGSNASGLNNRIFCCPMEPEN